MDFSIRSLRKISGTSTEKREARKEENRNDHLQNVIRMARETMGTKPSMTVTEIANKVNKKDIVHVTKAELLEVLTYYQKLQVVHIDNDEQVMFL